MGARLSTPGYQPMLRDDLDALSLWTVAGILGAVVIINLLILLV